MKKNKQDFFEQMKDSKLNRIQKGYNISQVILYVTMLAFLALLETAAFKILPINEITSWLIGGCCIAFVVAFVLYTVFAFQRNGYYFKQGDMSSGIKNYIVCGVAVYILLLVLYFSNSDSEIRSFIASLFAPITTVLAAILAIMGVHYTHSKQQKNLIDKNKLVFIEKFEEVDYEIDVKSSCGKGDINICLYNVSDNLGYFTGLYKVSGCEIYEVGNKMLYQPILPKKSYIFFNVCAPLSDEELFLVYKDIGDNYYYITFTYEASKGILIKSIDNCDIEFLHERLEETKNAELRAAKGKVVETEVVTKSETDDFKIKQRKEETRPVNVKLIDGYELIVNSSGKIETDTALLTRLKTERLKLARENKVRPYMIFNNQQLVAIATYKPSNKEEFISIYGLGEKKYELYGIQMIAIVKEFSCTMATV